MTPVRCDDFIRAMRTVASSVTVVTTDGAAGLCGATVSAFCSVSAYPPSALVCLRAGSRVARAVRGNRVFTVNVLPEGRRDLAERFAGRLDRELEDRFTGVAWRPSPVQRAPMLEGAAAFCCLVTGVTSHGTHLVVVGDVVHVEVGAGRPLTYHQGAYCRVAARTRGQYADHTC